MYFSLVKFKMLSYCCQMLGCNAHRIVIVCCSLRMKTVPILLTRLDKNRMGFSQGINNSKAERIT